MKMALYLGLLAVLIGISSQVTASLIKCGCEPGLEGPMGPPGPRGEPGYMGERGLPGFPGIPGLKGESGGLLGGVGSLLGGGGGGGGGLLPGLRGQKGERGAPGVCNCDRSGGGGGGGGGVGWWGGGGNNNGNGNNNGDGRLLPVIIRDSFGRLFLSTDPATGPANTAFTPSVPDSTPSNIFIISPNGEAIPLGHGFVGSSTQKPFAETMPPQYLSTVPTRSSAMSTSSFNDWRRGVLLGEAKQNHSSSELISAEETAPTTSPAETINIKKGEEANENNRQRFQSQEAAELDPHQTKDSMEEFEHALEELRKKYNKLNPTRENKRQPVAILL